MLIFNLLFWRYGWQQFQHFEFLLHNICLDCSSQSHDLLSTSMKLPQRALLQSITFSSISTISSSTFLFSPTSSRNRLSLLFYRQQLVNKSYHDHHIKPVLLQLKSDSEQPLELILGSFGCNFLVFSTKLERVIIQLKPILQAWWRSQESYNRRIPKSLSKAIQEHLLSLKSTGLV